jgi:hypothetical protein
MDLLCVGFPSRKGHRCGQGPRACAPEPRRSVPAGMGYDRSRNAPLGELGSPLPPKGIVRRHEDRIRARRCRTVCPCEWRKGKTRSDGKGDRPSSPYLHGTLPSVVRWGTPPPVGTPCSGRAASVHELKTSRDHEHRACHPDVGSMPAAEPPLIAGLLAWKGRSAVTSTHPAP